MELPEPPYYAVIFTSRRTDGDRGYAERAAYLAELAAKQPGYLGMNSVRDESGLGITVSYWQDEEAITGWRTNLEHTETRDRGRAEWYRSFDVQVSRVERAYRFERPGGEP